MGIWTFFGRFTRIFTPKRFPIAQKLALVFTLLISTGMVSLGLVIADDQTDLLERQMMDSSDMAVKQLAQIAKEPVLADDRLTLQTLINNLQKQHGVLAAAVYSEESLPIVQSGQLPDADLVEQHTQQENLFVYTKPGKNQAEPLVVVASLSPMKVDGLTIGYALIGFDRSIVESAKQQTFKTVGLITLFFVLIGSVTSIGLGKRLTRPINQIIKISSAISHGDYQYRFRSQRNDELGELMEAMNEMTEGLSQKEHVEKTFSRYVAPIIAQEVLKTTPTAADAHHITASVLFADIVGFTTLSESIPADQLNTLLNEYFSYIADIVDTCTGYIDKYIGDCVMAIFGVPEFEPQHAQHAVECAALIQYLVRILNKQRRKKGLLTLEFHIGVNSGTLLAGNIGAADRMNYTVMGKEVNTASRLSGAAKSGETLLSEATYQAVKHLPHLLYQNHGEITLRGTSQAINTYAAKLDGKKNPAFVKAKLDQLLSPQEPA
ncbi:adenylate/guanylate cyclase domain-containing protein [Methylosoma difficile]